MQIFLFSDENFHKKMAKIYAYTVDDLKSQQKLLIQKRVDFRRNQSPSEYEGKCNWIEDTFAGDDFDSPGLKQLLEIVNKGDIVFYTDKVLLSSEKSDWKKLCKLFTEKGVNVVEINSETGNIKREFFFAYEPDFTKMVTHTKDPIKHILDTCAK